MTKFKKSEITIIVLAIILVLLVTNLLLKNWVSAFNKFEKEKRIIVIDPGHGGRDPGKVAVNDALEKDINLQISLKIKEYLEQNDAEVIMIRESDRGLYKESDSNKKRADLNKRAQIIRESNADVVVSIHQNSFGEPQYKGAQVFYYSNSIEGKKLAEYIQSDIARVADSSNKRNIKANDQYFILRETPCPAVIVECGFLSNWEEANLLITEDYQDKIAWSIYMGINKYINSKE
ncbi:MAG: N-acetylmuramoyl-L-alanine amidase CwlD [Eubacteriales bacterium]